MPAAGERVRAQGKVISVKEKYGKRGGYLGVTVEMAPDTFCWFARTYREQETAPIIEGAVISVQGDYSDQKGKFVFLKKAEVEVTENAECAHKTLVLLQGRAYACSVCGAGCSVDIFDTV